MLSFKDYLKEDFDNWLSNKFLQEEKSDSWLLGEDWNSKHDINNQDNPKVDTKTVAIAGAAGAIAVSAITAGIIDLYRKAHNVTAEQIKGCNGNRKCVLRAYLDGTRKKIQILQRAKSKDSQHASKYDIRIAKLNVTATQYQNKISSIKVK